MDFKRDESLQKRKNTGYSDTARIMRRALGVTAMRGRISIPTEAIPAYATIFTKNPCRMPTIYN